MIQKNLVNRLNADPLGLSIKRAILFLLLAPLTLSACRSTISVVDYNLVSSDASSNISPLSHYIGMSAWQDADHALQLHADMTMRREELIAQCMLDAGFQYIPDIGSNRFSISGSIFDETKPNDLEWVSLYGFGIASGHIETAFSRSDRQGADPNQDYRDSLTKAELDAFFLALYGPDDLHPSPGMTESEWLDFWASRGCWGASHQVAATESELFFRARDEFSALFFAINAMWDEVISSPEADAIDRDWSNCMSLKGHFGFSNPSSVISSLEDEFNELVFWDEQLGTHIAFDDFQQREVALAIASLQCRESVNYQNRLNTLIFQAEARFIDDHRPDLVLYRDARLAS